MTTIQLILNISFTTLFFASVCVGLWFLWKIWQALIQLLDLMSTTIIDNSKHNVETIHHLSEVIDKSLPPGGP